MSSQRCSAYSWGLNLFGQAGVPQSPSALESSSPFDFVELPSPLALSFPSSPPPLKGAAKKSLSPQRGGNAKGSKKASSKGGGGGLKESSDDDDDDDMYKTNDPWKLRTMSGRGGGFILNDTFMVYGSMDDLHDDGSSAASSSIGGVAAGAFHTLLFLSDGRLFGCGWNGRGQLGLSPQFSLPLPTAPRSSKFGSSGASSGASPPVDRYPTLTPIPFPTNLLSSSIIKVSSVACGPYHSICSTTHGHVYSWGEGSSGQLGYSSLDVASPLSSGGVSSKFSDPSSTSAGFKQFAPMRVDAAAQNASQVAAGFDFSVVLSSSGSAQAFGGNEYGQLGVGPVEYSGPSSGLRARKSREAAVADDERKVFRPTDVPLAEPCKEVSCGDYHTLFLTRSGAVYSCGLGSLGRLGLFDASGVGEVGDAQRQQQADGRNARRPTLVQFFDKVGVHVSAVRCGGACSGAISFLGDLYTWGSNESGQLGVPSVDGQGFEPIPVLNKTLRLSRSRVADASFGEDHGAAVLCDGTVYTFGKASCGRLGIKDAALVSEATLVAPVCASSGGGEADAPPYAKAVMAAGGGDRDGDEEDDAEEPRALAVVAVESAALDPPPPEGFDYRHPAPGGSFTAVIGESSAPADIARTPICIGMVVEEGGEEREEQLSSLVARGAKVSLGKQQQQQLKRSAKAVVCGGAHTVAFSRTAAQHRDDSSLTPPLLCRCENEVRGCPGLMTMERMDVHLRHCAFGMEICPWSSRGCDHSAPRGGGMLTRHSSGCRFRPVGCDLCKKQISAKEYDNHLSEECPDSPVGCPACGDEGVLRKDIEQHLGLSCPERVAACPNLCGLVVRTGKGETLAAHEQTCPRRLVSCKSCAGNFRLDCLPDHEFDCCPVVSEAVETRDEEEVAAVPKEPAPKGALPLTQQERRAAAEQENAASGRKGSVVKRVGGGYAASK